ncbi:cGMP-specific 3',5'-cyclic phosphodiesterase-like isoform X2 [Oratosquilla oratoria]|uniref:cGMP-specific 3',5'-cyclic phosphodiesterase-like isoform X2 n=1 Tax=Oratosquilla oratoria TaxID=337810 RepID=UPI003F757297
MDDSESGCGGGCGDVEGEAQGRPSKDAAPRHQTTGPRVNKLHRGDRFSQGSDSFGQGGSLDPIEEDLRDPSRSSATLMDRGNSRLRRDLSRPEEDLGRSLDDEDEDLDEEEGDTYDDVRLSPPVVPALRYTIDRLESHSSVDTSTCSDLTTLCTVRLNKAYRPPGEDQDEDTAEISSSSEPTFSASPDASSSTAPPFQHEDDLQDHEEPPDAGGGGGRRSGGGGGRRGKGGRGRGLRKAGSRGGGGGGGGVGDDVDSGDETDVEDDEESEDIEPRYLERREEQRGKLGMERRESRRLQKGKAIRLDTLEPPPTPTALAGRRSQSGDDGGASQTSEESLTADVVTSYLDQHPQIVAQWLSRNTAKEVLLDILQKNQRLKSDEGEQLSRGSSSSCCKSREQSVEGQQQQQQVVVLGATPASDVNYSYPSRQGSKNSWLSTKKPHKSASMLRKKGGKLSEQELFMELIRDISTELDIDVLCHKILVNVGHLTQADRGSLFLAQGPKPKRVLVAKLFDVTVDTGLEEALRRALESAVQLDWGTGIVGHVASTKEIINIKDAYQDPRFDASIDERTGYRTESVLCMPVCNYEGDVIGVAEIINKKNGASEFTNHDVEVFRRYLAFCGIGIQNATLVDISLQEYKRNQLLLQLARGIFEEQTSLERLVIKIMTEARDLLKCERCSIYLLDAQNHNYLSMQEGEGAPGEVRALEATSPPPTPAALKPPLSPIEQTMGTLPTVNEVLGNEEAKAVSLTTTFDLRYKDGEICNSTPSQAHLAYSMHGHIARYVCHTRQTLNISDVEGWRGSPLEGDEEEGFVTKSVLTIPIYNSARQVLGVAQMINKVSGLHFSEDDINTFEAFAIFCGLGIQNTQVYEKACRLMARQKVALECLSYHATASKDDTDLLKTSEIPTSRIFDLNSFDFSDFPLTEMETCKCVIRMFMDLDFVNNFHIPYEVLCRWILSVKKNYRPVKYHNWRHALNVAQTMYAMLKTGKMERFMNELEMLGLIVACLSHDLDHRGTNNSFQTKTDSPLAILYSTSTMEHHHFDQCVMILSQDSNNIFQALSAEDYRRVMRVVENAILSTDMAMYFKKKNSFLHLSDNGEFDWQSEEKKQLLCGMMMTACDVSAIAKPWEVQHKTAKMVADEFFEQGDLERLKLNQQPVAMMDREKKDELPKMQVGFIDAICLPLYKALSESFPWVKPLYDGCAENRDHWHRLAEQVDMGLTWIDHEYIDRPVERNELAVISKIRLHSKPQPPSTQGSRSPSKAKEEDEQQDNKPCPKLRSRLCVLL